MKTRAEIYGNEATDLLRIVTMYPGLCEHPVSYTHLDVYKRQVISAVNNSGIYPSS